VCVRSRYFQIKAIVSPHTLSFARHLLLRNTLHNPFINKSLLQRVITEYLRMLPIFIVSEEETAELHHHAKKKLIEDISNRATTQSATIALFGVQRVLSHNLFDIYNGCNAFFNQSSVERMKIHLDFSYPFQPQTLSKKSFARLLQQDWQKFPKPHTNVTTCFLRILQQHAELNRDCLEILCITCLLGDSADVEFINVLLSPSLKQTKLFDLHPWLLCELSQHHLSFFGAYTSYLVKQLRNLCLTNERAGDYQETLRNLCTRWAYLFCRSNRLQKYCMRVLLQLQQTVAGVNLGQLFSCILM